MLSNTLGFHVPSLIKTIGRSGIEFICQQKLTRDFIVTEGTKISAQSIEFYGQPFSRINLLKNYRSLLS